jgi:SM-20-related protein
VVDDWLSPELIDGLAHTCRSLADNGALASAGVGQGDFRVEDPRYPITEIRWIEASLTGAAADWLAHLNALWAHLNEHALLGLVDCECHYACYPVGGYYLRHFDRFLTDDSRTVSCVLYLDEDWRLEDGGVLRIHRPDAATAALDILPARGRFVAFLSDRFEHEVLPTQRPRHSIAGWMRRRLLGGLIEIEGP